MALFSKGAGDKPFKTSMSDKKLLDNDYRSTMKADDPSLFGKLDKNVAVIIKNENSRDYFIDHGVYICFSGCAVHEQLKRLRLLKGETISAVMMRLGTVLKSIIENQKCRAAFLYGLTDQKQVIARRDIEEMKELINAQELLYRRAIGEISTADIYDQMKKNFVYVIGDLPHTDANGVRHLHKDIDIEKFVWKGDDARISALCYLDRRTARLTKPDVLTSSVRLGELADAFGTVILEPYSSNWIEFNLNKLK